MPKLYAFAIAISGTVIIMEAVATCVYGWFAPKEFIEKLLSEKWDEYMNNGTTRSVDMFYGSPELPPIWKLPISTTSTWYISELGRIPRWSKWHKKLSVARKIIREKKRREFLKSIGL